MEITIFGKGNMGKAIGGNFEKAGQKVTYGGRDFKGALGDMVVLAVPYDAVDSILSAHKEELAGKVVVDITNPVNFDTFDGLVVPADSSAAAEIQKKGTGGSGGQGLQYHLRRRARGRKGGREGTDGGTGSF